MTSKSQPLALITGASQGFGLALARSLASRGWQLILDARHPDALADAASEVGASAVVGDVADPSHRLALAEAVRAAGPLDLLVNNASLLGPSPQPALADYPVEQLRRVYEVDVFAPLALTQLLLPWLAEDGIVINVSSDAAVEPYPGWGGYGSAKAALDQLSAVLGVEHPRLAVYGFDPGDMRTTMHQLAYPGEDISDRPEPATAVPALLRLLNARPPSGRYRRDGLLMAGDERSREEQMTDERSREEQMTDERSREEQVMR